MEKEKFDGSAKDNQSWNENAEKQSFDFIEKNAPKRITVEQLRKHKELENVSDEEANDIIETLYKLAVLAYHCYLERENNSGSEAA